MTTRIFLCVTLLVAASDVTAQRESGGAAAAAGAELIPQADTFVVTSGILGRARRVFVSLPGSHALTTRTYPVIVVLDGEASFRSAVTVSQELARLGHVPEAIVVAIPNSTDDPRDRVHDMTPPGLSVGGSSRSEGGDRFLDFIEQELLPLVRDRFRGAAPAILIGHSSGGVIATWAAATRATFPVVISIDAPVHLDDHWLAGRLVDRARSADTRPLRYVSLETRFGWNDDHWDRLVQSAPPNWLLHRARLEGESHETMPFLAMYQGLRSAFRDYSVVGTPGPPDASAFSVFAHYRRIETEFGTTLPPPVRALNRLVEDLLTEGRVDAARDAVSWLANGYGAHAALAEANAMVDRVAAMPPLTETVETLKETPLPTPAQMQPFLGEWKGESRLNESTRFPLHARFRIEDGAVVAESYGRLLDGTMGWRRYTYVRVLSDGLEFGRMNGMRPAGMIILRGRLTGDVLEGKEEFRGIVLPLPTGFMPPPVHFRIVKQQVP